MGIGFDGQVVESMSKTGSFFSGHLAYYYHVLRLLLGYREKTFTLIHNGVEKQFPCFLLTLGNSTTFGGGFKITPQATIADGLLDVCAIGKVPVWRRPFCMKIVEKGKHLTLPYVDYFKTAGLVIKTRQTLPGHIDGELFYGKEFTVKPFERKLLVKTSAG
jgi:diacylglycerol kinase family enzyme